MVEIDVVTLPTTQKAVKGLRSWQVLDPMVDRRGMVMRTLRKPLSRQGSRNLSASATWISEPYTRGMRWVCTTWELMAVNQVEYFYFVASGNQGREVRLRDV